MSEESLSTGDRITRLEGEVAGLKLTQAQLGSDVRQVLEKLSSSGKTNWALIFAAISVLVAIVLPTVGALALFITLQIKTEVAPLQAKAEVSVRDRGELHESLRLLTALVTDINSRERETTASQKAALIELETQLRANSQIANVYRSNQQQILGILWREMNGYDMPKLDYYTDISLPKPQYIEP